MTTTTYALPSRHIPGRRVTRRLSDVLETIYSAPAPLWGTSAADHTKRVVYLVGSVVLWIVLPLLVTAAFGGLLSL